MLADGETLSPFVEASAGDDVEADTLIDGLQRKLDAARTRLAKKGR